MTPCIRRPARRALLPLPLAALFALGGCFAADDTQNLRGTVDRASFDAMVIGARVVAGDTVIATAPVAADGRFELALPRGTGYRLEILAADGAHPFVRLADRSLVAHTFDVCDPGADYDVGVVLEGDNVPDGWWDDCMPNPDGTCSFPDDPDGPGDGPDGGDCGGDRPPGCPEDVPVEDCWADPCQWDPMACEDPCLLYPEACDPCMIDPERCQDPCAQFPELCEDPCLEDPSRCEDPCATNPELCECPDGSMGCDPCELDPALCDPCLAYPELCDPCFEDPSLCDPCATRPELCECDLPTPDGSCCEDPDGDGQCNDVCADHPELCDPCFLYPELCDPCMATPELCEDPCWLDPALCDPCRTDPALCEDPGCMDPSDPNCWPPEPPPCDANGVCDGAACAATEEPIPSFGCEGGR